MDNTTVQTRRAASPLLSWEEFQSHVSRLDVDPLVAYASWENLSSGQVMFLVMSGKMGSGKDTIAPLVLDRLNKSNAYHLYYADALKNEADRIFEVIRKAPSAQKAKEEVAEDFDMSAEHAASLVDAVYEELKADPSLHARSRTGGIRRVLQLLGTEVRRSVDPDYWVNIALASALIQLAAGRDVYVTDARFPNEIAACGGIGALTVRLNVTEQTQRDRLLERDGILPSEQALAHVSETSLDEFEGFGLILDNNGSVEQAVAAVVARWNQLAE